MTGLDTSVWPAVVAALKDGGPVRAIRLVGEVGPDLEGLVGKAFPKATVQTSGVPEPGEAPGDVVVCVGWVLDHGIGQARDRMARLGSSLAAGGRLVVALDTLGTALDGVEGDRAHDALLFPHLAARGEAHGIGAAQVLLGVTALRLLVGSCGFDIVQIWNDGGGVSDVMLARHGARLSVFSIADLQSGSVVLLLERSA